MIVVGSVFAAIAAVLHVLFFMLESVWFSQPRGWKAFGVASQAEADVMRPWALNQGFYNLFLAVGTVIGLVLITVGKQPAGGALVFFGAGSMVLAGLVLLVSDRAKARSAAIQAIPPILGILFLAIGLA